MSDDPGNPGLLRSATALGIGRVGGMLLSFGTLTVLVRQLGPEPFGIVGMATGLIAIVNVLGDAGVQDSLVTDEALDEGRVGAALLVTAGLALLLAGGAALMTPLVVRFYDHPGVAAPWLLSTGVVACHLLGVVPRGLAERHERFSLLAGVQLGGVVIAALVAVPLAYARQDVWPLLAWQGIAPLFGLLALWLSIRPRLARPSRAAVADLWGFSRGILGFTALNVLSRNADDVLIGRVLGERALGYYTLCYRVLRVPLGLLGDLFLTVSQPRLVRLREDPAALGESLGELMGQVAALTTPICIGAALAAPEILSAVFGPSWLPAQRAFQLLALCGIVTGPWRLVGACYTVSRNTQALARWGLISTPFVLLSFVVGLPWGVTGVAAAVTLTLSVLYPIGTVVAARVLGVSGELLLRRCAGGILRGAVAAAPLTLVCLGGRAAGLPPGATLALTIAVGAACWLALGRRTWRRLREAPLSRQPADPHEERPAS